MFWGQKFECTFYQCPRQVSPPRGGGGRPVRPVRDGVEGAFLLSAARSVTGLSVRACMDVVVNQALTQRCRTMNDSLHKG